MQTYRIIALAALVAAAGCIRGNATRPAPAPAPAAAPPAVPAPAVLQQGPAPVAPPTRTSDTSAIVVQAGAESTTVRADSAKVDSSEITRRTVEVFGEPTPPAAPATIDSAAAEPTWDMEVRSYETVDRVQFFVQRFSGPARERIESWLERGSRYEPMIRAKMRAGGLPEDMYYLALVESGFDPNAYSRAAAVGMWQFMTSTARDMGMRVDWWIDERRDPVRSTAAAVRFIRGMKQQFGSLYLAAAAYDGGPGRISRGLTRYADDLEGTSGEDAFFVLADKDYLRRETKDYVPQLIAAALIGKDPQRYGMRVRREAPFAYDSVRVGPSTPLAAIAKASGTTTASIKELNPQVLRGMTPPRDSFLVRIPPGTLTGFDSAFAELPKSDRVGYRVVESKKGERIEDVASRVGVRARDLEAFNPNLRRSKKTAKLFPGQSVLVPTAEVVAAATSVPDPSIERFPGSRTRTTHVVKHGETLFGIALKYHTTVKSLMAINGLKRPMIFPGQELAVVGRVPRAGKSRAHASKAAKGARAGKGTQSHSKPAPKHHKKKRPARKPQA